MNVKRLACGSCITCPFAFTEESEQAQNYGCLPDIFSIAKMHNNHSVNWACHYDDNRICSGFATMFKESDPFNKLVNSRFNKNLPLVSYEDWVHKGEHEAVRLAKERWATHEHQSR